MDSNNALRLKKAPPFTNILENEILLNDVRLNIFYCITGSSKWIKKKIINKLEYEIGKERRVREEIIFLDECRSAYTNRYSAQSRNWRMRARFNSLSLTPFSPRNLVKE